MEFVPPTLSLSFVGSILYVMSSPFNLLSVNLLACFLDCVIYFTKESTYLYDQSAGWMIGAECEFHDLYQLSSPISCLLSHR